MTRLIQPAADCEASILSASAAWEVLIPAGAIEVDLHNPDRPTIAKLRQAPVGTEVVFVDSGPVSNWRCRLFAARAGLRIRRTYLAFPSVRNALYVVDDDWCSVAWFWTRYLTAPPGRSHLQAPLTVALWVVRTPFVQRLITSVVAQRVVVGRRY
ncbi:MAG: hypothetical protein M3072_05145 [Candidatus Dormibacteraeota bacterium]|jgi:hypothetical protein|nr:hypothetical protein [Candidatus Dormibacteraeota bacterium]